VRRLEAPSTREICRHFPEWLPTVVDPPDSPACLVALPPFDRVANTADPRRRADVSLLYTTIRIARRFPFWEALPYWLRVYGVHDADAADDDAPEPSAELKDGVLGVSNGSQSAHQLFLTARWWANSVLIVDAAADFRNRRWSRGRFWVRRRRFRRGRRSSFR
jgi:hypothetical protein